MALNDDQDENITYLSTNKFKIVQRIQELKDKSINDIKGMLQSTLGIDPGDIIDEHGEVFKQEHSEVVFIEYVQ